MASNEVQGPKGGIFGIKNLLDFQKSPIDFLMHTVHEFPEDIVHWKFGPQYDTYLLVHPDYIHELLVKKWSKVVKWERFAKETIKVSGPGNLVILEGDAWKKTRKLSAPAFHTQRIKHYIDLMVKHTTMLIDKWEDGDVYEMSQQMVTTTMGIIGEILFDIPDIEKDAAQLSEALFVLLEMFMLEVTALMPVPDWVPTPRNLKENAAMKYVDDYMKNIIKERRASGEDRGDVLSALLHAVDEDDGGTLSDSEVGDNLMGLFIAGHETTAVLMTWTLYMLAKNPEIQEQLYQEVSSVMSDGAPSLEDLETMTLTDRILQETLRLYPPAWSLFLRETTEELPLGEHTLPKGAVIYISPWVVHHDPRWWPEPQKFDPSRFEGDWKKRQPTYSYIPFGGGPRVCIGSHLAEMEAEVILATIIKNFKIELQDPEQIVNPEARFTVQPAGGMHLRVRRR